MTWLAVAAWMGLIFVLSSRPDLGHLDDDSLDTGIYKLAHLFVYAVLGGLIAHALSGSGIQRHRWWAIVVVALYAMSDEVHQAFVPGRSPSLLDVGLDAVGGFIGMQLLLAGWLDRGLALAIARLQKFIAGRRRI